MTNIFDDVHEEDWVICDGRTMKGNLYAYVHVSLLERQFVNRCALQPCEDHFCKALKCNKHETCPVIHELYTEYKHETLKSKLKYL